MIISLSKQAKPVIIHTHFAQETVIICIGKAVSVGDIFNKYFIEIIVCRIAE